MTVTVIITLSIMLLVAFVLQYLVDTVRELKSRQDEIERLWLRHVYPPKEGEE